TFEFLGCGDQFKARLETYKLEGDAHSWWMAYKQAKGGDAYVATLSWNDFCDIFFLQYFPYSEKEKYEREYKSIHQLPEETSIDFMKRFLRLTGFLGAKAGTQEEQTKHFKWGLNDFVLDRILNIEFTDVAQVANAARNNEIFRDRSKNKGNNKRDRDGHRIRPSETPSQGSNQRAYDLRDSDRYGNGGRYGNKDSYGSNGGRSDRQGSNRQGNGSDRRGHQARVDTRIMPHLPHVTFVGNFIRERRITGLLVLALNVESDFDIILGMDWLTEHRATIDCYSKRVIFGDLNNPEFIYHGSRPGKPFKIISALKARTLISHGCEGFLASIKDTSLDGPRLESHQVVRNFPDVFPDELPGLPPERDRAYLRGARQFYL
ncbi:zinc finger, CCHC-type, retrotransposon gag domain protein, partial [Tanacetum coccineum]